MPRERVAETIYVFTSSRYLEVAAGLIITPQGCVVIDTLPFPSESRQMYEFARRNCTAGIRWVINTHFHADHIYGNYLFEGIPIIAHEETRVMLERIGEQALQEAQQETPELQEVRLRLPDITYRGRAAIRLANYNIELIHAPGHSSDCTMVYIEEEKILFAGDAVLPVPYIVGGDLNQMLATLQKVQSLTLESVVQGHGGVLLRGEITETLEAAVNYLKRVRSFVHNAVAKGASERELLAWDVEKAGLSRVPLGGMAQELHRANLLYLYRSFQKEKLRRAG